MKPILYESTEKEYLTNGIGVLSDVISCKAFEERNGKYEIELIYPITGLHYEKISNNKIIFVIPSEGKRPQPFRVYKISKPISGKVIIYAQHKSYDLNHVPVAPFNASSAADALIGLVNNSLIKNEYSTWTDISGTGSYVQMMPSTFRKQLGGVKGSILDSFGNGAELEFDRDIIKLYQNRGHDNGVVIRYGKNLTNLKQEESIEAVYTGVLPFYYDETKKILVQGDIQYINNHLEYPNEKIYVLDTKDKFNDIPTKEAVNAEGHKYVFSNKIGIPKISLDVSFAQLWQTEEYRNIAPLERVGLCDTVHVIFDQLGVNATAKVVKTEFDCLNERYISIKLGTVSTKISEIIEHVAETKTNEIVKSALDIAVKKATDSINGTMSGYVTKIMDSDGNWSELVISDHKDLSQAKNVWRWTQGGLGFSSNGYSGPYETAITSDGKISADSITTGTLDAGIVKIANKTLTERNSDANIKTQLEQTAEAISQTVTKKEFDGTMSSIINKFDDKGLHIKRKINGQESKKEAILNDDELRFTRADGTDAVRINEHESYFGKWVTIASHRLEVFPIHEWDAESVGGINRDSQTISGTGLFYSGDSEGV